MRWKWRKCVSKSWLDVQEFDIKAIQEEGYETITPVLVTNVDSYNDVLALIDKDVKEKDELIKAVK